ncbi:MAG: AbrB/MazE/SpoVT family DNA-binding domain-containing protein [Euryarchaeota archaeon]|nr:AbrB/MazE/SpoVT family DNA-binding domain-containing protein [Euryarchaeota archaeon]
MSEYGKMICPGDKVEMEKKTFHMEGFEVRGWRCRKCGEEAFHGEDAEIYLLHKKLQKEPAKAKVGVLGKSTVLRIKKEIAEALGLKKGTEVEVRIEPPRKVVIEIIS